MVKFAFIILFLKNYYNIFLVMDCLIVFCQSNLCYVPDVFSLFQSNIFLLMNYLE